MSQDKVEADASDKYWGKPQEIVFEQKLTGTPVCRGSSPSLPANIFFLWRETYNFEAAKTPKKTDRRRTKRGPFFDTMRIPTPPSSRFSNRSPAALVDQSENWRSSVHVLFNSTCTDGRHFVVFFVRAPLGRNNMVNFCVFFVESPFDVAIGVVLRCGWHRERGGMLAIVRPKMACMGGCHRCSPAHAHATTDAPTN